MVLLKNITFLTMYLPNSRDPSSHSGAPSTFPYNTDFRPVAFSDVDLSPSRVVDPRNLCHTRHLDQRKNTFASTNLP